MATMAKSEYQMPIGGEWGESEGGRFEVTNPATGAVVGTAVNATADDVKRAIDAAEEALGPWKALAAIERARILRKASDQILAEADLIARVMTDEQGKPLAEARGEVVYAASFLEWFAGEAERVYGMTLPPMNPQKRVLVLRQPVGVTAAITPWNFPAAMMTRKLGPALAAGCTMIVKPAEQTPLSALAMAELATRAGVPAGVLNVLTGPARPIGAALTGDARVRKLSFTGSTEVGRLLAAQCAPTIKRLSLELGGNAAFIVFDDADLDAAVEGAIISKYRNTGQTCVCANRLLVQEGIYEAFATRLAARVAALKVGDGLQAGVEQGPLIDAAALAKVEELMADARAQGARVLTGGARHALGGTFYQPTVLTEAQPAMRLAHEEIFGPVAPLYRFRDEADAVRLANATEYGLASYFYSRDVGRVWRVARALECGIVGINTGLISTVVAPFGGVKQSGLGREGSYLGIDEYLDVKYLCMGGL